MPPSAMIAPASTKNGIVSIANLLTPLEICSITASTGMPIHSAPAKRRQRQRIGDRHAERDAEKQTADDDENVHAG